MPGLLERLAQVPDPRDPRGVLHALTVVLAPTACAVLAGPTSLLAVGVRPAFAATPATLAAPRTLRPRIVTNRTSCEYAEALEATSPKGASGRGSVQ